MAAIGGSVGFLRPKVRVLNSVVRYKRLPFKYPPKPDPRRYPDYRGPQKIPDIDNLHTSMVKWPYYSPSANFELPTPQRKQNKAVFPPIKPRRPPGKIWRNATVNDNEAWRLQKIVEDMDQQLDMPNRLQRMEWKEQPFVWRLYPFQQRYNLTPYINYITKTNYKYDKMPALYDKITISDELFNRIKPIIIDTILQESYFTEVRSHEIERLELNYVKAKIQKINDTLNAIIRALTACLIKEQPFFLTSQLDECVRVEAGWQRWGYDDERYSDGKIRVPGPRNFNNRYKTIKIHFMHKADLMLRTEGPLEKFLPMKDKECRQEVPSYNYQPQQLGQHQRPTKLQWVPGFHFGDPCEFTYLSVHNPVQIKHPIHLTMKDENNRWDFVEQAGISISHAICVGQAHYQGFSMYHPLTYPFTTQTIISDGQEFSFFAYQLNTLQQWCADQKGSYCNVAWSLPTMKLYDSIENGEIIGFDDDTLKWLMKFFLVKTRDYDHKKMRPNLPENFPNPHLQEHFLEVKDYRLYKDERSRTLERKPEKEEQIEVQKKAELTKGKAKTKATRGKDSTKETRGRQHRLSSSSIFRTIKNIFTGARRNVKKTDDTVNKNEIKK